jgi:hypothetical protein
MTATSVGHPAAASAQGPQRIGQVVVVAGRPPGNDHGQPDPCADSAAFAVHADQYGTA